jgi:hypothetical protein
MTIMVPRKEKGLKNREALIPLEEKTRASKRDACKGAIYRQTRV